MVVKFCTSKKDNWDMVLDGCIFAYNTSCHESILYTPFEIMFGRKATLPIDLKMEQVKAVVNHGLFFQDNVLDIEEITKQRCSVVKQVKENIEKAQIKQKQNYDRRHANPKAYQIGTKVLKKDFTRKKRKGGKMDCRYVGPFVITKSLGKGLYSLASVESPKKVTTCKSVNSVHLKPYLSPTSSQCHFDKDENRSNVDGPVEDDDFGVSLNMDCFGRCDGSKIDDGSAGEEGDDGCLEGHGCEGDDGSKGDDGFQSDDGSREDGSKGDGCKGDEGSKGDIGSQSDDGSRDDGYRDDGSRDDGSKGDLRGDDGLATLTCIGSKGCCDPQNKGCSCRKGCNSGKSYKCKKSGTTCSVFCHPLHSCTNCKDPSNTQNIFLISDERNILPLKGIHPPPLPWQNWFGVALTLDHKKCIENGKWLCDYIIHASQMLLKNTYPNVGGLQNPLLAVNFSMEPCQKEFIQILNLNNNHWITVSTIGCSTSSINVYDSMHLKLSNELKKVVADVMKSSSDEIVVKYCDVQWQKEGSDCGHFAIAFAISLCCGINPTTVRFEQEKMRPHLIKCLETKTCSMFPSNPIRKRAKYVEKCESISIYCSCRLPNDGKPMVQCSQCLNWYHSACLQCKVSDLPLEWNYSDCQ